VNIRRLAPVVVAALVATTLTACIGQAVRSTEDWLAGQPHVVSIGVPESTVDELSYNATLRAELDPAATDADIDKLIDDSLDYIADKPDVKLQFGMHGIDFEVATKADARTALALWHQVVDLPNVVSGFVSADGLSVQTLRTDAFATFDSLKPLGVTRTVDGYHAKTDFDVSSADYLPPLDLTATPDCTADPTALALAQAAMDDDRVAFGTLDLCAGLDVTFKNGYDITTGVSTVRGTLDAAGLSDFPVTISVAPDAAASADYHIVAVTPGDADALGVVNTIENSGVQLRYELAADRTLSLESSDLTAAQLFAALSGTPNGTSLGAITITGSDTTVTGALGDLPGLLGLG